MQRILLVDDDPAVTETLAPVLRFRMGVEVEVADSGEHALELLQRQAFDLVLADFRLPGMSGLELLRLVNQRYPGLHRVLVTSHLLEAMADPSGPYAHLEALMPKPYSLKRMRRTLADLLAGRPVPEQRRRQEDAEDAAHDLAAWPEGPSPPRLGLGG